MSAPNKKQQKSKSKSGSKKEGKPKAKKSSKKARQIPIKTDEQSSEHVQLLSDVEIKSYVADQEKETEDVKYSKPAEIKQKYWDEVEMKHHGLVDDHAHHKELQQEKAQSKSKVPTLYENKNVSAAANFPGHVPYDEIAMKQSGFVDNHCHHMTEQEIDHDDGKQDNRHVEFPSILSGASAASEAEESDQSKSEIELNPEPRHLKMESKVDTIEVDVGEEEKYKNKERAPMGAPTHLPWDELELKEHGLVDKQGHHKVLPEDEVQLHREGKIDEHGRSKSPDTSKPTESRPIHLPFDELAMKQSGYLDDHCHHLTEQELNKKRTPVSGQKHVDTDNISIQSSTISSRETPRSTPNATGEQKSPQRPLPQTEPKLERKVKSKPSSLRSYKLKLKGTLNMVESGSNKAQPIEKPASPERRKQQENPVKAESEQKRTPQPSSDSSNKDTEKKSPKREPAKSSQRSSKKERPKSKASKRKSRSQPPETQASAAAAKVEQNKPVEIKDKEKPKEESPTDAQANKDTRKKKPKRDPGKSSSRKSGKKRPKSSPSQDVPRSQPPQKQPDLAVTKVEGQQESAGKKDKDVGPTVLEVKPAKRQKSKREKSTPKQGDE